MSEHDRPDVRVVWRIHRIDPGWFHFGGAFVSGFVCGVVVDGTRTGRTGGGGMTTVAQIMLSSDAFWLTVAAYVVCRVVDPRLGRVWSAAGMTDGRDVP